MKKSRKAQAQNTLVTIVAVVLSFLVVSFWLFPAVANARGRQAENVCKASVDLGAGTALKGLGAEIKVIKPLCKTLTPKIKGDKKKVQEQLEKKMKTCWDMFGAGTYDSDVFERTNLFGGGKNCFTCYSIPVESSFSFKGGKDSITSEEFMQSMRDSGTLNYIQSGKGNGRFIALMEENKGIQPEGAYAISYKPGTGTCTWCGLIGGGAVGTAGALIVGGALFLFPEPATTVAGAIILSKVALVAGAGFGVAAASGVNLYANDVLDEAEIDTLIFTDISTPAMANLLRDSCNFVEGVDD